MLKFWIASIFLLFLILGSAVPAAPPTVQADAKPTPPSAQTYLTEFLAGSVTPPVRDDYTLYTRLKSHNSADPQTQAHTKPRTGYAAGDKDKFWVFNLQTKQFHQVTATCIAVTAHVYMFLDDAFHENTSILSQLAQDFENKIYPTDHQYFGSEWNPGVDQDPHLVILNTIFPGASGYFSANDEFLQPVNPYSNEREMFYINVPPSTGPSSFYLATLSHEFQHMIEFHTHYNQASWLNEANSVLAQQFNSYTSGGVENFFFSEPATQLGAWTCSGCGTGRYYGVGYSFVSYLNDQYGAGVIRDLTGGGSALSGLTSVDYALAQNKHPELDSQTVFKNWVTANLLNQHTADSRFTYKNLTNHVQTQSVGKFPAQISNSLPQYSSAYYQVDGANSGFTLNFQGQPAVGLTGTAPHSGSMVWWANRGDNSDSTLTHDFDLSGVKNATLKFWTWFDIESNYDFLYIEASADGGATWDILPGKYTSNQGGTGQAYGEGLTGRSNSVATNLRDGEENTAEWVQENIVLSKYAGKKIKLRFEYLTDDGYNKQGALLDDFEIPEIGFNDNVETGENGWQAAGWVRDNNLVPQHYLVRVVSQDGACASATTPDLLAQNCIQDLALDPTNTGQLHFPFHQAVIIVAPYTAKTLMPTNYTLNIGQ